MANKCNYEFDLIEQKVRRNLPHILYLVVV